jgi:hypothetical protein
VTLLLSFSCGSAQESGVTPATARRRPCPRPPFQETAMLFLVVSTPGPERPSAMRASRERYWQWMRPLIDGGEVRHNYARAGRGAVAVLDVASNERLHAILNEWCELIPARFEVYPLLDPAAAREYLAESETVTV